MLAKDLMTKDLYTLEADHSLNLARFLMQARHIRHIPIVDQEFRFQGLLTHRDLLEMSVSVLAELDNSEQAELHRKNSDSQGDEIRGLLCPSRNPC